MSDPKKRDSALRLMEALSAADPAFLEASENRSDARFNKKTAFFRKPGIRGCLAACVCFLVCGAVYYTCTTLLPMSSDSGIALRSEDTEYELASFAEPEEMQQEADTASLTSTQAGGTGLTESARETGAGEAEAGEEMEKQEGATQECEEAAAEKDLASPYLQGQADAETVTLQEACRVEKLGAYVPAVLPEGYRYESGCVAGEEQEQLVVAWSRGEEKLTLQIRTTDDTADAAADESPLFSREEITEERIALLVEEKTPEGSSVYEFSVQYEDGITVVLEGCGTPEEIWTVITSINP